MELWDTITNEITIVEHPPGFENSRFFRPVIATFDDNSIILAGSRVHEEGLMTFVEFNSVADEFNRFLHQNELPESIIFCYFVRQPD